MDATELKQRIVRIVAGELRLPEEQVTPELTPDDAPDWDSLKLLNMVLAIEDRFSIEIDPEEVESMTRVGSIIDLVRAKTDG